VPCTGARKSASSTFLNAARVKRKIRVICVVSVIRVPLRVGSEGVISNDALTCPLQLTAAVKQKIRVIRVPFGFNDTPAEVNDADEHGKVIPKRSLTFRAKYLETTIS